MEKTPKVRYSEMFPDEYMEAFRANPIAYLAIGSLEWHGHHNVLGLDTLKAQKILELVAQRTGGIVFPPLYLGCDAYPDLPFDKYPNKEYDCYHLDADLLQKVITSYVKRMIHSGFKTIYILAGHYPNSKIAQSAIAEIDNNDVRMIVHIEPDLVSGEDGDHAGKWETSLMLDLLPELVDLSRMEGQTDRLLGVFGTDPNESTKEYGQEMVEKIVAGIVSEIEMTT